MRFAVRRPAVRPVIPRGARATGGDVPALPAGPSRWPARRDGAAPAGRVPAPGRRSLARMLTAAAGADPYGESPVSARGALRATRRLGEYVVVVPGASGLAEEGSGGRAAPRGLGRAGEYVLAGAGDSRGDRPGQAAASGLVVRAERPAQVEDVSPYGPEVAGATRVPPGRCEQALRLGPTTDHLLLHHLSEGRPRPEDTEIPGRERRSLPGVRARALTPRGR